MLGRAFFTYLEVEKNYSPHTIHAYSRDLQDFHDFLVSEYDLDVYDAEEVDAVKHRHIRTWMGELLEEGLSRRTVARKIASLSSYFRFLRKTGKLDSNPATKVTVPKFEKKLPAFMKQDSIDGLFEAVEYPETFEGRRDKCILEILYSCGLRRAELVGLKYEDIDFSKRTLRVLGKGRKERIVPFGEPAAIAMRDYIEACKQAEVACRPHFLVRKDGKPIYPRLVHRVVEKYLGQACSLSKKSPHVLRHTFATHLLNNGADLNAIKELLGHTSLAATQVYLHNSISKLKDVYNQAHPKARSADDPKTGKSA